MLGMSAARSAVLPGHHIIMRMPLSDLHVHV